MKGESDIDLVVMLNGYDSVRSLKTDLPGILNTLESYLRNFAEVTVIGTKPHAVEIKLPDNAGYRHPVDILPAVDVLQKRKLFYAFTIKRLSNIFMHAFEED